MTADQSDQATGPVDEPDPLEEASDLLGHPDQLRGHALYAAVELGIVEELDGDPASASDVAAALDLDRDATVRLLRALGSFGVLVRAGERFSLTPVGERFLADHPESVREFLLFYYDPDRLRAVRHFPAVVASGGETAYDLEYGHNLFDHCEANPEFATHFNGMQDLSRLGETDEILDTLADYDFDRFDTLCDVGGGYGDLLSNLLVENPGLEGVVLELPSVLADEDRLWAPRLGVDDRCRYVGGDMFESVPAADCYVLKAILHDWPDEDCVTVLENIHDAGPADARLLVRERVLDEVEPSPDATTMDVWMLLETGGRERTRAEFADLFEAAGWELARTIGVNEEISILEAVKA